MKPTTRFRILDFLRRQHTASTFDLSAALGLTRANIRHHLVVLESNSLVEVIGQRQLGKGRPENIYGLSRRVLGDALDELSSLLLDEILERFSDHDLISFYRSLAKKLQKNFPIHQKGQLPIKLADLVRGLNELHYQAHWEASPWGPRVVIFHCPFMAIIDKHPELCRVDQFLLTDQLEHLVIQTSKLERTTQALPQCVFTVSEGHPFRDSQEIV